MNKKSEELQVWQPRNQKFFEPVTRLTIYLTKTQAKFLKRHGGGIASAGVRRLIADAMRDEIPFGGELYPDEMEEETGSEAETYGLQPAA